jgi:hypothetical protein
VPRLAPLCLLALLAGCALPPPPPPLAYPPAARERLIRLALAEWQEWGCRAIGLPGPPLAPCTPAGPPRRESEAAAFPAVLAYWRALPPAQAEAAIPRNRALYAAALAGEAEEGALWAEPFWSAAFISWLMAAAGLDAPEFAPDAAHARYLDHLDALAAAHPRLAPFLPRDPAAHPPAPGDLLCFDRSATPLARWADRAAERGRFRPMHCDLVVAVGPGVVEAVGGNVQDAVALARFPADAAGRLLPGTRPFLVVMENRLGRTPPWEGR